MLEKCLFVSLAHILKGSFAWVVSEFLELVVYSAYHFWWNTYKEVYLSIHESVSSLCGVLSQKLLNLMKFMCVALPLLLLWLSIIKEVLAESSLAAFQEVFFHSNLIVSGCVFNIFVTAGMTLKKQIQDSSIISGRHAEIHFFAA